MGDEKWQEPSGGKISKGTTVTDEPMVSVPEGDIQVGSTVEPVKIIGIPYPYVKWFEWKTEKLRRPNLGDVWILDTKNKTSMGKEVSQTFTTDLPYEKTSLGVDRSGKRTRK